MAGSAIRRAFSSIGGEFGGRVLALAQQLLLVPIFLNGWGATLYGGWLATLALATTISAAHHGFGQASARFILKAVSLNRAQASAQLLTCLAGSLVIAVVSLAALIVISPWLASATIPVQVLIALGMATAVTFVQPVMTMAVAAELGRGWVLHRINAIKVIELMVTVAVLWRGAAPFEIALLTLLFAAGTSGYLVWLSLSQSRWFRFQVPKRPADRIASLARSSLDISIIYIATVLITTNGPRAITSMLFAPHMVAALVVNVTYFRVGRTIATAISNGMQVEIGSQYLKDPHAASKIVTTVLRTSIWITFAITVALLSSYSALMQLWVGSHITVDWSLALAVAVWCYFGSVSDVLISVMLILTGGTGASARILLLLAGAALVCVPMSYYLGLKGVAFSFAAGEIMVSLYVLRHLNKREIRVTSVMEMFKFPITELKYIKSKVSGTRP